ncbi:MAG TPA: DUF4136 domain-containing protein [Desulfobacterales bacterium]|nr:DUF4136 domain-containing protein [Desulfobacterales bacterium]
MRKSIVLLLLTVFLLLGCAIGPSFLVKVDSISIPEVISEKTFILLPGLKDVNSNDLQFKEYASYVERALTSAGYIKAKDFKDARIAIFLSYGIGAPKEHVYSYSLPVWGQTGVSSSTTYGTITSYGSYGTFRGTTTYTPTYGITGYTTHIGSYTTFFRFLILDAVDLKKYRRSGKVIHIWRTTVTSRGSSGDLRRVFPVLVAAAKPYIGTNTGKQLDITLTEQDKAVLEIKALTK